MKKILNNHLNIIKNIYFFTIKGGKKMAEAYEYLIGGIICLIISVVASIMQHKFSAPSLVGIGLFI